MTTRGRRAATALTAVAALLAAAPPADAGPTDAGPTDDGWTDVELEHQDDRTSWMADSWASGDQSWHVGTRMSQSGGEPVSRSVVEHCVRDDCKQTFPHADDDLPAGASYRTQGVTGTSPDDVWVVGYLVPTEGPSRATTHHWDGTSWTEVANPGGGAELRSVSAASPTNVWAVGSFWSGRTLVLHFDGRRWSEVEATMRGCTPSSFVPERVSTRGRSTLAVGRCGQVSRSVLARYRTAREQWVTMTLPQGSRTLRDVDHVGRTAWAVGSDDEGAALALRLQRRPGPDAWVAEPVPATGTLHGVTGSRADDVWAVGSGTTDTQRLAVHWDGTGWSHVDTEHLPGPFASVALLADGTPYAAGQRFGQTMLSRYDRTG